MRPRPRAIAILAFAATGLALPLGAAATGSSDTISTFAGTGVNGAAGDGGPAAAAELDGPHSISLSPGGGLLIADAHNHRIRRVAEDGSISTVAGTGAGGFNGDGLPATMAQLDQPEGVAKSPDGFLIADTKNNRIREVLPLLDLIITVAGSGANGYSGDGLAASLAQLSDPAAIAPTPDGGFLIADTGNHAIRKVSPLGLISTVAGDGTSGSGGDGGNATAAQLDSPHDVAPTDDGGFLIADTGNDRIRKVDATGDISTVAGDGTQGYSGDGGDPLLAQLDSPEGVEAKSNDAFLIADTDNHVVRKVKYGVIKTTAGDGNNGFAGDGGDAEAASLNKPTDVLEHGGATLIADHDNHRVRLVGVFPAPPSDDEPAQPGLGAQLPIGNGGDDLPKPQPPKVGEHLNAAPGSGSVKVKRPGEGWVHLEEGASIPIGSLVDARRGSVKLTSARDANGATQTASFSDGTFKLAQRRAARPVTELVMRGGDFGPCWRRTARRSGLAMASARRKPVRRLWGSGKGRFRTRGRHGAATVRGTIWLTEDSCDGTRVSVRRGLVAVSDRRLRKTVMVRAGHSHLARPKSKARRRR